MKRKIFCFFCLCMIGLLSACTKEETVYLESDTQEELTEEHSESSVCQPASCYVYICGEVSSPGVYEVPEGARICDVLELAGGFTEQAAAESVNQAQKVEDGQMIQIYSVEQLQESGISMQEETDSRIDINRATKEQLMTLPGIGSSKADSIMEYREKQGGFGSIEELMNIPGIKSGVFEKIKDSIRIS